ncbi:protocadherin Fat 4 isoform X3 [Brienomyrus brachyistius]|uniref:protocadherin Fat 4 isoform X3 n=1 Tax=Brienomyrus brachyistius TaxID=42636 RepID=UPI0020B45F67|nr:protocadherin Fat 4 isoform X3 [Brienomyrus brachyistius]
MAVLNILVACVAVLYIIDGHFVKDWNYSFREQKSLAMDLLHQNASGDKFGASGFGVYRRIKRSALMASSKSVYSFEVREDTAPGAVVGRIETGQPLAYPVLVDDDGGGLFLLNPVSGEFTLARALDYESEQHYILTVGSRSRAAQAARLRVYFNIIDVNDNPPIFSSDSYSAAVAEDASAGACFLILNATDADSGMNAELNWTVAAGNEHGRFAVSHSGALCLEKELDRETVSLYILTIQVSDCGQPLSSRLTGTARVTILVKDVNDNAPSFKSTSMIHIPEDTPLQTEIMVVQAVDLDSGLNGHVLYELENWSGSRFRINSTTGAVYLEEPLDRELVNVYKVRLTARDQGFPQLSTSMNLTVLVEDVNDNDPAFSRSFYNVTVSEDLPRGTSLLQVHAYDADADPNGLLQYYLSQDSPFLLDAVCGVLSLKDKLDRERLPTHILTVFAVDQGVAKRSATAIVQITVTDINDCVPLISPPSVTLHVLENEDFPQIIHQVSAYDEDVGLNTLLLFFIDMGNEDDLFSLSLNGTLQTLQSLDREQRSQYTLHIIAVDSGIPPLTGTGTIQIIVDDINDNPPIFVENFITAVVSEDIPTGSTFSRIHASDIDDGINGEIRYFVENENVPFTIDDLGHMITTAALDREAVNSYRLTVVGRDMHPTHPLNSSVTVSVKVSDVNDQWPRFLNGPYVANIPTTLDRGSIVCAVSAKDEDTGVNAQLTFSLFGRHADWFSIDPFTGIVFTSDEVKVEDDITVGVRVEDGGNDPKSDSTTVTIRFQNVLEFPLLTVGAFEYWVSEDDPLDTLITIVTAETTRKGPISYYLASGNFELMFRLDQETGELTIGAPLDYESYTEFQLCIEARDAGFPPFSTYAEVFIHVRDVNDNSPVFTKSVYTCEVFENLPASVVCEVLAIDADLGLYGEVQYSIVVGNMDGDFTIDANTGIIQTLRSLDREKNLGYKLIIQAVDKENTLNTGTAIVYVTVLDKNDHAPRFLQIFHTEVSEDAPIGSTVIQITSTDEDIGENAVISYTIANNQSSSVWFPFAIEKTSGSLVIVQTLDREIQSRYIIKVIANDSAWSVGTDVTVDISDINDNGPVFSQSQYVVTITESKNQGVFVMQVKASDADSGENGQILYYIDPPDDLFGVNASTGDIETKQPVLLNKLESQSLSFIVVALDCGEDPYRSNTTVIVTIVPYNYFAPNFLPFSSVLHIPYNLDVGTMVIQLSAVDEDYQSRATAVEYTAIGGNASVFFEVDIYSGQVRLKDFLRQSLDTMLTLIVMVKDKGIPPLSSETNVNFVITNKNHFSPRFSEPLVLFWAPEDVPVGFVIGRVHAEDKDDGINGLLSYAFKSGNDNELFFIGKTSGLITLIKGLDYEVKDVHLLCVIAKDGGWISKTGELNVTVIVEDMNDNPPVFSTTEYRVLVPENAPLGTTVTQVKASDRDSGANAEITYSLLTGDQDLFVVDSKNGTITTRDMFDFEVHQAFELSVKASNTRTLAHFSVVHVYIQITGLNEFVPKFRKSQYNITVSESMPAGTRLGKVSATDYDLGPDGEVFYLLIGPSKRAMFNIDKHSGEIFIAGDLRKHSHTPVVLQILAKNRGSINGTDIDETLVWVNVLDANDPPKFYFEQYIAEISEDCALGALVTQVQAEDQDSKIEWRHFFYRIERGNTNKSFTIHPVTGDITSNAFLDRERWPVYNLTVTAIDSASPPATGSTHVVVMLQDVNDNAPILFSNEVSVLENQPYGTVVTILNASDADIPPNQGPFTYQLVKPVFGSGFSLTLDGILSTTQPMDCERNPKYSLLVVVQDAGDPPLSSTATVQIRVLDENDNPSAPRNIYIEVKYYGKSFPGGLIGNVQPNDPDEMDVFNCSIKTGPTHMFNFPLGNCDLWSSPYEGEATYNISVEANDYIHPSVNSSIYVNYKGFIDASVNNCVLFYVSSPSFNEFLSFEYLKFIKALDGVFNLQASKSHVFAVKDLGESVLLLAAFKSYNGQYLSGEVASNLSAAQKKVLEARSHVKISHITSNPCLTSPCQNGATCSRSIYISQDFAVLESPTVILVSPRQMEIFNCSCLTGFTGTRCETDIDECNKDLCRHGATCINYPGGFSCQCMRGFTGKHCSSDIDECQSVPCHNGGTCLNIAGTFLCSCQFGFEGDLCEHVVDHCMSSPCLQGRCINVPIGYTCDCPFGTGGEHCEEQSYGFEELSYMEFPALDPKNNVIFFELATVQENSLLLHNHGNNSSSEFLALEIIGGEVQLSYNLGDGVVRLKTQKKLTDGLFHSITARRTGKSASIQVDSCPDDTPIGYCFSQTEGVGSKRTLDVGSINMTFGGIKSIEAILLHPAQIRTHDFVGCVRSAKVNGKLLDSSEALTSYNVLEGCPRATTAPCHGGVCLNGGVCLDHWSHHYCQCRELFTGVSCATALTENNAVRLNGQSYIEYIIKESYKREQHLTDLKKGGDTNAAVAVHMSRMEVKFITTEHEGILFSYWGGRGGVILGIKEGKLVYRSSGNVSSHLTEAFVKAELHQARWHVLHLVKDGPTSILYVDSVPVMNTTGPIHDVDRIMLGGGIQPHTENELAGFSGCVEYFKFNGHVLPFDGFSEMVHFRASPTLSHTGCLFQDACSGPNCWEENSSIASCASKACQNGGTCNNTDLGNTSCICLPNFEGKHCELCSSSKHNPPLCAEAHHGTPLWIIGAILPASLVLLSSALLVLLRRLGSKSHTQSMISEKTCRYAEWGGQGMDNKAFHGESGNVLQQTKCIKAGSHPDIIRDELQDNQTLDHVAQSGRETRPVPLQADPRNSEIEYYEVDSFCSIFQSETYTEIVEPVRKNREWPLQTTVQQEFVDRQRQENLSQRHSVGPDSSKSNWGGERPHQGDVICNCIGRGHLHQSDYKLKSSKNSLRKIQTPTVEVLPMGLSVDELRRLTAKLDKQLTAGVGHPECSQPRPEDSSSESVSHSGFTCSVHESERELPFIRLGEQERISESTYSPLNGGAPLAEVKGDVDDRSNETVQHWERLLNLGLHFDTYAHVFEDIAALTMDHKNDSDVQSDGEEII